MVYSSLFEGGWPEDPTTHYSNCNAYGDVEDGLGEDEESLLNSYLDLASDDSDEEDEYIHRHFGHRLPTTNLNMHTIAEESEISQPASPSTLAFQSLTAGSRIPRSRPSLSNPSITSHPARPTVDEIAQGIDELLNMPVTQTSMSLEGPEHLPLGIEVAVNAFRRGEFSTGDTVDDKLLPVPLRHIIPPLISSSEEGDDSSDNGSLHSTSYTRRYYELEEPTEFETYDETDDAYNGNSLEARYFRTDPGITQTDGDHCRKIEQTHLSPLNEIESQAGSFYLCSPPPSPLYEPFHKALPPVPNSLHQVSDQGPIKPDLQIPQQASTSCDTTNPAKPAIVATQRLQEYIEARDRTIALKKQERKQASPPRLGRLDNLRISELFSEVPAYKGDNIHPVRRSSTLPRPSVDLASQAVTPPSSPAQYNFTAGSHSSIDSSGICSSLSHPVSIHNDEGQADCGIDTANDVVDAIIPQAHSMPVNGQLRRRPSFDSRAEYAKAMEKVNRLQRLIDLDPNLTPAKDMDDEHIVETNSFPMKVKRSMLMRESVYQRKRPKKRPIEPRRAATGLDPDNLGAIDIPPRRAVTTPIMEVVRESIQTAPIFKYSNSYPTHHLDLQTYSTRQQVNSDPYPPRQEATSDPPSPRHVSFDLPIKPHYIEPFNTPGSRNSKFFGIADNTKLSFRGGSTDTPRPASGKRPSFSKRHASMEKLLRDGKDGVKGLIGSIRKTVLSEENRSHAGDRFGFAGQI